jgi:hypothetical protein
VTHALPVQSSTFSNCSAEPLGPSTLSEGDGGGVSGVHGGGLLPEVRLS